MSGPLPSQLIPKLEKLKETSSHNAIALPCILVILFMIGQWLQYEFVILADEVFVNINCLTLPTLQCILEMITFVLFFSITPVSPIDISDKVEGIIIVFVCHTFGVFLSECVVHHSKNLYFTPAAFMGLPLLVLQNRICTGIWERPIGIVCHVILTCGAMLMTSYQDDDNGIGTGSITIAIVFYLNLRNIMLKRLAIENICLVLHVRVICTYVSILMLMLFIVGLLGIPQVTSLIMTGLFSSAASVVTIYLLLDLVFNKHSVFFVTILHLWSRILLQVILVSPSSYVALLTGGAIVCVATIVYVAYNLNRKDIQIPMILKEHTRVSQYEIYTRMEFLIYVGCVIGLIVFLLQPGLSDRDRVNLKSMGIHSVVEDSLDTS